MRSTLLHLCALLAFAGSAAAEVIGTDQFTYPNGNLAGRNGGLDFDFRSGAIGHDGTPSAWKNLSGAPQISGLKLLTSNNSATRAYNGTREASGAIKPRSLSQVVYYAATLTTGATLPDFFGLSSYDSGTERVFFGKPYGRANFGIEDEPGLGNFDANITVQPNNTYTLVARLDFRAQTVRLYVNPDVAAPEPAMADAEGEYTRHFPSTSVRVASGFTGSAITWSSVTVATAWDDFRPHTVVTTELDEDNGNIGASGAGVSLREAVLYSPAGSLITFAPGLEGKNFALTLGSITPNKSVAVDASAFPKGVAVSTAVQHFQVPAGVLLELKRLRLSGASAGSTGGSIKNEGTLRLTDCTFSNNRSNANGGAIASLGTLEATGCTFNANVAGWGGAIYNAGSATLRECTFTDNESGRGGALAQNSTAPTVITHCTIAGNRCVSDGLAAGIDGSGGLGLTIDNTILVANTANGVIVNYQSDAAIALVSQGYNLSDDAPAGFGANDLVNNANAKLGPLADNGGPTQTLLPNGTGAGVGAGDPAFLDKTARDQRGFLRLFGERVDIGAVEVDVVEAGPNRVVTTLDDHDDGVASYGDTTLREAINSLIQAGGGGTIYCTVQGIINLRSPLPDLAVGMTIEGSGVAVRRDSGGLYRIFRVSTAQSVNLSNLIVANGDVVNNDGGGIFNGGTLHLTGCTLSGNHAGTGGGLNSGNASTAVVSNCTFSDNSADYGAAISGEFLLQVDGSTLEGNNAAFSGSAIHSLDHLVLTNSTIYDNVSQIGGGAIIDENAHETFTISHCTIVANRAIGAGNGGGIDCFGQTSVTMTHTILAGNTAAGVASNYKTKIGSLPPIVSHGYNLSNDAPSGLSASTNDKVNSLNFGLSALVDNGGPTATIKPSKTSDAYNGGDPSFAGGPATDQRGFIRVLGGRIDIGAVEVETVVTGPVFTVTTADDHDYGAATDGDTSLREAINAANAAGGANTIQIPFTTAIQLLQGTLPKLATELTIKATNSSGVATIDAGFGSRHFEIGQSVPVTLEGLRLIDGFSNRAGGSISNDGVLTLTRCTLSGNVSDEGGGAIISSNELHVLDSTLNGNSAGNYGGAVVFGGTATFANSTFTDNEAHSGGGAIANGDSGDVVSIHHCTIVGNRGLQEGAGGGLDFYSGASATLGGTILAANTSAGTLANYATTPGALPPLISDGGNLSDDVPAGLDAEADFLSANPNSIQLGSLGDHGGPTQTMVPLSGSLARDLDFGESVDVAAIDQRGYPRLVGNAVDAGAVEAQFGRGSAQFIGDGQSFSVEVATGLVSTLVVTSDNDFLFPPGSIALDGTGSKRNLPFNTLPNRIGDAKIRVIDAGTGDAFELTLHVEYTRPAKPRVTILVASGAPAPAGPLAGSKLTAFSTPALDYFRDVVARTTITSGRTKLSGILHLDIDNNYALEAYQGGPTGTTGVTFKSFGDAIVEPGGEFAFTARLQGKGAPAASTIWTNALVAGSPTLAYSPSGQITAVQAISIQHGQLLALVKGSTGKGQSDTRLIGIGANQAVTELVRTGASIGIPPLPTTTISKLDVLSAVAGSADQGRWLASGRAVTRLALKDGRSTIVSCDPAGVKYILGVTGDATGLNDNSKWAGFGLPAQSEDARYVAAAGTIAPQAGVAPNNNTALGLSTAGDVLKVVLREDGETFVSGLKFAGFSDPVVNSHGNLAFLATVRGTGVSRTNASALFTSSSEGEASMLARLGQPTVPDADGNLVDGRTWAGFLSFALPDGRQAGPVLVARLRGPKLNLTNNVALFARDSHDKFRELLRAGDKIGVDQKQVKSFTVLGPVPGVSGTGRGYNDTGSLAALAKFTDGSQAVIRIDIP